MKKICVIALMATSMLLMNCAKENAKFKITKEAIGLLNKNTKISDLETIYAEDSIVTGAGIPKLKNSINAEITVQNDSVKNIINPNLNYQKIEIYEKGGLHLLTLTPATDTTSTIENIRIHDVRYTTDKGLNMNSTFKDIKEKYSIKKIITSMNNVLILIKDSGLYFTIDKKELPESLRYDASLNIEEVQIPDAAKIKYIMLAWE